MVAERFDENAPPFVEHAEHAVESAVSAAVVPPMPVPASVLPMPIGTALVMGMAEQARDGMIGTSAGQMFNKEEAKSTMDKAMKTAEDMVTFGQGNVEAFMKSGQIWAAGVQDLGKHFAETAQAQFEETLATMKAIAGVKSVKEAMDLHSTLARSSMDKAVAATSKLTDAVKLTEQAIAPLTARVSLAVEKFSRAA